MKKMSEDSELVGVLSPLKGSRRELETERGDEEGPPNGDVVDEEMSHAAVALNLATFFDGLRSDDRNVIAQDTVIQIAAGRIQ